MGNHGTITGERTIAKRLNGGQKGDNFVKCDSPAGQIAMETADSRLKALGLTLPSAPQPVANYVPALFSGDLLFISGQISKAADGKIISGVLGAGLDVAAGQAAARLCALNILAQAQAALGDLERIVHVLRLTWFVASAPAFTDQPQVVNGASDLMVAVLGDRGRHTRSAVGVASLPLGAAVEVDAILRVLD
jgi:enamine deaminase RidA (YjgF/YER057c/UK114 family)